MVSCVTQHLKDKLAHLELNRWVSIYCTAPNLRQPNTVCLPLSLKLPCQPSYQALCSTIFFTKTKLFCHLSYVRKNLTGCHLHESLLFVLLEFFVFHSLLPMFTEPCSYLLLEHWQKVSYVDQKFGLELLFGFVVLFCLCFFGVFLVYCFVGFFQMEKLLWKW